MIAPVIRFIPGDAIETMRTFRTGEFDLVLTDPPEPEKDIAREYLQDALTECLRISSGPVVWLGVPVGPGRTVHGPYVPSEDYRIFWFIPMRDGYAVTPIYVWRGDPKHRGMSYMIPYDHALTKHHPGAKPVSLMGALRHLFNGQNVCDPFCGIGSLAYACQEQGSRFTGIDINPDYLQVAMARVCPPQEVAWSR